MDRRLSRGLQQAALLGGALVLVIAGVGAMVWQLKAVWGVFGVCGLIVLMLVPRRLVTPISISVILALACAVAAPNAPSTGWLVTSGVAVLLLVVALLRGERTGRVQWAVATVFVGFWALLGISTVIGNSETPAKWLFMAIVPVCLAVLGVTLRAGGVRFVALAIVALSVIEALLGVAQLTVMHQPIWGYPLSGSGVPVIQLNPLLGDRIPRAQGSLGHPVVLGFALAVGFVITWVDVPRLRGVVRWPVLLVLASGLVLTGTRSALAAAALGVLYALFAGRDVGRKVRAVFLIAFIGAAGLVLSASIRSTAEQVSTTGSYTHRLGALDSVVNLIGRPVGQALFGSGAGSERSLFLQGLLQADGFYAIDNELVTVLATAGVLGVAIFLLACAVSFFRAAPRMRGVLIVVLVMFFSFDVTTWGVGSSLLALALTLAPRRDDGDVLPVMDAAPIVERTSPVLV
ncbi:MAG: O-antigen ligase family protein [Curtobacterium sp.]